MGTPGVALLLGIVFFAFAVEASLGFGATVIAVALGSLVLPIATLVPALASVNLVLSAAIVLRHRDAVDRPLLFGRIAPLMAVGLPVGVVAFRAGGEAVAKAVFAGFVVALAALELARARSPAGAAPRPLSGPGAAALLLCGGVVHGAFATGGPMAVYVAGRHLPDKRRFRSTLSALWLLLNAALTATFVATRAFPAESARLAALFLVPLAAGLAAGEWIHGRVRADVFRTLIHALLLAAGLLLLAAALGVP